MTSCKPPPTCIDASPIPDANDSRMSAIPYEANLTPMGASPLRYSTRSRPGLAGLLHPLSPGALADAGRAAGRGAAAERGGSPLRAGTAPLCAGPVSSGAGHRAALSGAAADHRLGHLHAAGHAPAD